MNYNLELTENELFLIHILVSDKRQELACMMTQPSTDAISKLRVESAGRLYEKYDKLYKNLEEQVIKARGHNYGKI